MTSRSRDRWRVRSPDNGDFLLAFQRGRAEYAREHIPRLQQLVDVADDIGWTEPAEAPDLQVVAPGSSRVAWARDWLAEMKLDGA